MSYTVDIYSQMGEKVEAMPLDVKVFSDERINMPLIHEYYRLQMSNARHAIANTKTRGQIRGSGRKLYRQKGTGSARVGDKKSPLRKKGGIVFGPTNKRNYSFVMNKKSRKRAMAGLLSKKVSDGEVVGIEQFDVKEINTKYVLGVLRSLPINGKVLVILQSKKQDTICSLRNIDNVKVICVDEINPRDILSHKQVLFEKDAIIKITEKLQ